MNNRVSNKQGLLSLSPLFVFLLFYLVLSIVASDFYAVPITVAFLFACLYSMFILRGKTITERFQILNKGASNPSLIQMLWIFILSGAFASSASEMGAVDAAVNLTMTCMPSSLILAGLFIASCFISISIGTSVGTIAALTPIAAGISEQTGFNMPIIVAIVVGGSYFGDNLSFISDTTIMATRTQGCNMSDKFKMNIKIALPAALIAIIIYTFVGIKHVEVSHINHIDYLSVLPYLFVLFSAIAGMNVMLVLIIGLLLTGLIGMGQNSFHFIGWMNSMSKGILGMGELIIVTLMAAGLIEVIRRTHGIQYLLQKLTHRINGRKGAELSIAGLVTLTNFCTANNTIAILTVGPIAKEISSHYGVDPRRSASILDTFGSFAQGLIPYGAQMLIACGLSEQNPLEVIPHLYYPYLLGIIAILNILIHNKKKKYL